MITLTIEPTQAPMSWRQFLKTEERWAVALDGYVIGEPNFDPTLLMANFNHHEKVNRLATRATCAQVLMAIRQGFFRTFRDERGPRAHVRVNDCDEDVCTSWFLLKNSHLCTQSMNPLLNRLVAMEDALDATAGAYPFPADLPTLRELAWVFEPYRNFRLSGQLDKKIAEEFRSVVDDVEGRIGRHITGQGKEVPLDLRYEKLGGGKGWTMVKEVGAQARTGMFSDGIQAYVSVRERGAGRWTYTVGRMSNFIPFDCHRIFTRCNAAESSERGMLDIWGGSDMVGGSPRVAGSAIPPSIVEQLVNDVCQEA